MPTCLVSDCNNYADNNLGIRCRTPETYAIWAPNCDAYLCNEHAYAGCEIEITITPNGTRQVSTNVSAGGTVKSRTTAIKQIKPN